MNAEMSVDIIKSQLETYDRYEMILRIFTGFF